MNNNGGNQRENKNIWQGKRRTPSLLLCVSSPLRPSPALFNGGGDMYQSWIATSRGRFVVKTGIPTPRGFVGVKKTDTFNNLEDAKAKVKLCNYIWQKCRETSAALLLVLLVCNTAFAMNASWYSVESLKKEGTYRYSKGVMANGKIFSDSNFTCANRLYPLGTFLKITNLDNGKSVVVQTTDRIGKRFATKRIDISKEAFAHIASLERGIIPIKVEVVR